MRLAAHAAVALQNAHLYEEVQAELAARRVAEAALEQAAAELEQRVAERTAALQQEMVERQRLAQETQRLQHFALLGRLTAPVLLAIGGLLVTCFGLAALLAAATSATLLDAYLATTPGGLYAVLAVAYGSGADTTFIVAVQGLRLLVVVLLAPLAVRRAARRGREPA